MDRFHAAKFYALCRYICIKDQNQAIDVIPNEIKKLFKDNSIPYKLLFDTWISSFENLEHEKRQKHVLDIDLGNLKENLNFKIEFSLEPKIMQKIKLFVYCRLQLSFDSIIDAEQIIEEVKLVFKDYNFGEKNLKTMIKQFNGLNEFKPDVKPSIRCEEKYFEKKNFNKVVIGQGFINQTDFILQLTSRNHQLENQNRILTNELNGLNIKHSVEKELLMLKSAKSEEINKQLYVENNNLRLKNSSPTMNLESKEMNDLKQIKSKLQQEVLRLNAIIAHYTIEEKNKLENDLVKELRMKAIKLETQITEMKSQRAAEEKTLNDLRRENEIEKKHFRDLKDKLLRENTSLKQEIVDKTYKRTCVKESNAICNKTIADLKEEIAKLKSSLVAQKLENNAKDVQRDIETNIFQTKINKEITEKSESKCQTIRQKEEIKRLLNSIIDYKQKQVSLNKELNNVNAKLLDISKEKLFFETSYCEAKIDLSTIQKEYKDKVQSLQGIINEKTKALDEMDLKFSAIQKLKDENEQALNEANTKISSIQKHYEDTIKRLQEEKQQASEEVKLTKTNTCNCKNIKIIENLSVSNKKTEIEKLNFYVKHLEKSIEEFRLKNYAANLENDELKIKLKKFETNFSSLLSLKINDEEIVEEEPSTISSDNNRSVSKKLRKN